MLKTFGGKLMNLIEDLLVENPIVAAIRNENDLLQVIKSRAAIVFVLYGSLVDIKTICDLLKANGKIVFIHLDMIEGLKADAKGIQFIKENVRPYGIITTKSANIKYAKSAGLFTIQRVFIIDSLSLETGIKNILTVSPDAVEVMPGVASKIIDSLKAKVHLPIIAGGLIQTQKEVKDSVIAGATAISTTCYDIWDME
jgi:glycerol uptake operon antiterminator